MPIRLQLQVPNNGVKSAKKPLASICLLYSSISLIALLQVLVVCELSPGGDWTMEGASINIFVTVQKIYYPLLCIMGIPGSYFVLLFGLWLLE